MNTYQVTLFRNRFVNGKRAEGETMSTKRFDSLKSAVYYALSRHSRIKDHIFGGVFVGVNYDARMLWRPLYAILEDGTECCYGRKCQYPAN